jgi:hypothetical protein
MYTVTSTVCDTSLRGTFDESIKTLLREFGWY